MITLIDYMQERGMRLERKGMDWWASCCFHTDNTPSLKVSEKDGVYLWYCFSCKRGGSAFSFVAECENIPEWAARKKWAELTGTAAPEEGRLLLTSLVSALAVNGHPYLRSRGITDGTCLGFGVGYCDSYDDFLRNAGVDRQRAAELGLFDFSKSMIYPFFDHDGCYKVAARSLNAKVYLNSPSASTYAREGLWGAHLLRGEEAWIFEGYHDAMIAKQYGYQAVAACGTNMTRTMWQELRDRHVSRVVVVPDGDAGGRSWLERLAVDAPSDMAVEFVALKSGDPDDAILAGEDLRSKTVVPFEWLVRKFSPSSLADRIRVLQSSAKAYLRMPKSHRVLVKDWYIKEFGDDAALDYLHVDVEPDIESERVVLANCLYSRSIRLETLQELEDRHFTTKMHRALFAMAGDREVTPQMAQVELGADMSNFVDLMNYRFYIDRVKAAGDRQAISRLLSSADLADVGGLVEDLYKVANRVFVADGADVATRVMEKINDRVRNPAVLGLPIPNFPILNTVLLGLVPGRLILVSGNSGHGKTTTACNILSGMIDDYPSLFVSLEMTDDEIMEKQICIRAGIPSAKVMTGSLEQFEYDRVVEAAAAIKGSKLRIAYGINDLYKMVALIKAHVMRKKARIVVIDYLQLISVPSREERWEQLSKITAMLKTQVCSMGATVIAITQLKRSALLSDVPDAADQAGAYAMLNDADVAITVRKMDPKDTKDGSNYLMYVSKNRFGLDNVQIPCTFDRVTQRISEL